MANEADRIKKLMRRAVWSPGRLVAAGDLGRLRTLHSRPVENLFVPHETLKCYEGTAYLDPKTGYVITERGLVIEDSMMTNNGYYFAPGVKFVPWRHDLPSYSEFRHARSSAKTIDLPKVVSLRHFWEWNFYHFYADVLGKLSLIERVGAGVDIDTPIALGPYAYDVPFVREIISRGELAKRNWILPTDQFIRAEQIIYCQTRHNFAERFGHLVPLTGAPEPDIASDKRIFLTRRPGQTRSIVNDDAVRKMLASYGFETVDAGALTIAEQQALFASVRHLVAVHGAGMVNMIYRRTAPMSVIELHAGSYVTEDMKNIALQHGHDFARLGGEAGTGKPQEACFTVDLDRLRELVESMLTADGSRRSAPQKAV